MTPSTIGKRPNVWRRRIRSLCHRSAWRLYQQRLAHSQRPILVGPFTSEVGFEALYWLPWLAALRQTLDLAPERLIPLTRGGAACWYDLPVGLEVYAMRSIDQVRVHTRRHLRRRGTSKQYDITPFDRALYADAAKTLQLDRYLTLHPSWMYRELAPFWEGDRGLSWIQQYLTITRMHVPPLPDGLQLPKTFVAVRFYARSTWPAERDTAIFAKGVIDQLRRTVPVILLNPQYHADDHVDFAPTQPMENVVLLSDLYPAMTPDTGLAVQSAVIARALGFVGTYGGLAHLALRFERPVFSFYKDWTGVAWAHLHLCYALAQEMNIPHQVLRLGELPILQQVLPNLFMHKSPSSVVG